MTALALLPLLTDPGALGDAASDGAVAWEALETWLATPRVVYLPESHGIDQVLGGWASDVNIRGGDRTDASLAAFAPSSGSRLVTFDSDFGRFGGLSWLRLAD